MEIYPESFAFVQVSMLDEHATPWGNDRWNYNGAEYTPPAVFSCIDLVVGAGYDVDQQYGIYRTSHFLPQRAIPTDVTIALSAEYVSGQTYRVAALIGIEADGLGKALRVQVVQVLDH